MIIMNKLKNDNIRASVLVFPSTLNGLVPFYLADKISAANDRISISIAVSVFVDNISDEVLSLRLVKCEDGKFKGRELKKIKLNGNENDIKYKKITVKNNVQISTEERYRLYYTFSINNIAIIGEGTYAVVLVKMESDNSYIPLATYYFNVKESS